MERLEVDNSSDDMAIAALTKGLKNWDLVKSMYLDPLGDFDDIMNQVKDHRLAKEALQSSNDEIANPPQGNQRNLKE